MEQYKCKELNKSGIVILPKKWRDRFALKPGNLVDLEYDNSAIVIKKHMHETKNNSRVINEEGSVLLPMELRNLMGLTPQDEFCLYIDEDNERFIVKAN
ncbi:MULTISPECIES: AbrB/MazE/SpoVT family DNA-binding domain-containing protein [unclassified Bacillus (in: firmicutes)]|uniref:AbrB/MazE/SpoVT family DNA-binding domain-containing protein n=1 Tax=unclassified Bacillus (in: firmicutes) TaxID=185979 RepID=UPI0008E7DE02|nr:MULTISPECIES: AbrB/MazE/SpoVT family DNA-binding domain-containing protein [unclassified Bacillus (in: firmicutes)]SFA70190.1 looped-hinge helix DNA binding domain-containing protein, AbrB family [Bacillus sp. UNCCL13]SFQ59755.1 looped-hinge helix DNA binding domain-containing protein, AbrB family [Bacillus sp. cl95]